MIPTHVAEYLLERPEFLAEVVTRLLKGRDAPVKASSAGSLYQVRHRTDDWNTVLVADNRTEVYKQLVALGEDDGDIFQSLLELALVDSDTHKELKAELARRLDPLVPIHSICENFVLYFDSPEVRARYLEKLKTVAPSVYEEWNFVMNNSPWREILDTDLAAMARRTRSGEESAISGMIARGQNPILITMVLACRRSYFDASLLTLFGNNAVTRVMFYLYEDKNPTSKLILWHVALQIEAGYGAIPFWYFFGEEDRLIDEMGLVFKKGSWDYVATCFDYVMAEDKSREKFFSHLINGCEERTEVDYSGNRTEAKRWIRVFSHFLREEGVTVRTCDKMVDLIFRPLKKASPNACMFVADVFFKLLIRTYRASDDVVGAILQSFKDIQLDNYFMSTVISLYRRCLRTFPGDTTSEYIYLDELIEGIIDSKNDYVSDPTGEKQWDLFVTATSQAPQDVAQWTWVTDRLIDLHGNPLQEIICDQILAFFVRRLPTGERYKYFFQSLRRYNQRWHVFVDEEFIPERLGLDIATLRKAMNDLTAKTSTDENNDAFLGLILHYYTLLKLALSIDYGNRTYLKSFLQYWDRLYAEMRSFFQVINKNPNYSAVCTSWAYYEARDLPDMTTKPKPVDINIQRWLRQPMTFAMILGLKADDIIDRMVRIHDFLPAFIDPMDYVRLVKEFFFKTDMNVEAVTREVIWEVAVVEDFAHEIRLQSDQYTPDEMMYLYGALLRESPTGTLSVNDPDYDPRTPSLYARDIYTLLRGTKPESVSETESVDAMDTDI